MKEFFDTSVLIASFWRGHPNHDASLKRLPVKHLLPTDQAMLFVQEVRDGLADRIHTP